MSPPPTPDSSSNSNQNVAPNHYSSSDNSSEMSTASTSSNTDRSDINRELNTYKDRLAWELTNFKKQLETWSKIEVECAKQNLKTQFGHELRQQTLTHAKKIETLRQQINQLGEQLQQQQAAPQQTNTVQPQMPLLPDIS